MININLWGFFGVSYFGIQVAHDNPRGSQIASCNQVTNPRWMKSNIEGGSSSRMMPYTDENGPSRAELRSDGTGPDCAASRVDEEKPRRDRPQTERARPSWTKD